MLIIRAGLRDGVDGYWTKTFPVTGGRHYQFDARYQAKGVELLRPLEDDDVDMIPLAMVNDTGIQVAALKGMPKVEPIWGLDFTRLSFQ